MVSRSRARGGAAFALSAGGCGASITRGLRLRIRPEFLLRDRQEPESKARQLPMGLHLSNAFGRIPCEPRNAAPAPGPTVGNEQDEESRSGPRPPRRRLRSLYLKQRKALASLHLRRHAGSVRRNRQAARRL